MMSYAEYLAAAFGILVGAFAPFNGPAFAVASALAIGFAVHKGIILGYGFCPAIHVFLMIIMSTVVSAFALGWWMTGSKMSSTGGTAASGPAKLTVLGVAVILGPFLAYSWAGNLAISIDSDCKAFFGEEMKDMLKSIDDRAK